MTFLPKSYVAPADSGKYAKLKEGDNIFRVLSEALLGYIDWEDKKPIRYPYDVEKRPKPKNADKPVKHFWAFVVWDYKDSAVKILEITQAGIRNSLYGLINDKDWGDPSGYDINIIRSGEGLETEYQVIAKPPKPVDPKIQAAYLATPINLKALLEGADPFNSDEFISNL